MPACPIARRYGRDGARLCGAAMRGDAARETEKPAADLPPVLLFSQSVGMKLFEILISAPSSHPSGIRYLKLRLL